MKKHHQKPPREERMASARQNMTLIVDAIGLLKSAKEKLKAAGATFAVDRVQAAIQKAEYTHRHAAQQWMTLNNQDRYDGKNHG